MFNDLVLTALLLSLQSHHTHYSALLIIHTSAVDLCTWPAFHVTYAFPVICMASQFISFSCFRFLFSDPFTGYLTKIPHSVLLTFCITLSSLLFLLSIIYSLMYLPIYLTYCLFYCTVSHSRTGIFYQFCSVPYLKRSTWNEVLHWCLLNKGVSGA